MILSWTFTWRFSLFLSVCFLVLFHLLFIVLLLCCIIHLLLQMLSFGPFGFICWQLVLLFAAHMTRSFCFFFTLAAVAVTLRAILIILLSKAQQLVPLELNDHFSEPCISSISLHPLLPAKILLLLHILKIMQILLLMEMKEFPMKQY